MVLIDQLHTLPDAKPADNYWTLAQLVNRRDTIVNDRTKSDPDRDSLTARDAG